MVMQSRTLYMWLFRASFVFEASSPVTAAAVSLLVVSLP